MPTSPSAPEIEYAEFGRGRGRCPGDGAAGGDLQRQRVRGVRRDGRAGKPGDDVAAGEVLAGPVLAVVGQCRVGVGRSRYHRRPRRRPR